MNFDYKLPKGYTIKELSNADFDRHWEKPGKKLFNDAALFPNKKLIYSKKQTAYFKELREQFQAAKHHRINLGLFHKEKFVGWSWGYQETPTTFYMCNSAVLENHRGQGLYACLMKELMRRALPKGYDQIYSRHHMTNNAIIIAKLKQGFKITNSQLSYSFGVMLHLTYFPSQISQDILDFRAGFKRPDRKMRKVFSL